MARTKFTSIDDYLAAQPAAARGVLARVRRVLRDALPVAEEAISYQIPVFRLNGRPVIYFAGWREHYSVYPASEGLVAAFQEELAGYAVNKGTIRFPLSAPVPSELLAGIARFLAQEHAAKTQRPGQVAPKRPAVGRGAAGKASARKVR